MPTLERKIRIPLIPNQKEEISRLEEEFLYRFWSYVPNGINKIAMDALTTSIELERACKIGLPVVSLDRVYVTDADKYLEVTRVTDKLTGKITVGERPGTKSLIEQVTSLRDYKEIVLVDVGAFEGETILKVCGILEEKDIKVVEIFLGYSSIGANKRINNDRKMTALNLFEFYEWVELRDLFGIDGRRTADGGLIPYWDNLIRWASISPENDLSVKQLCKEYNQKLMNILGGNLK